MNFVGVFISAMVFTNITQALFGDSTVMRYRFTAVVAIIMAVITFAIVSWRMRRAKAAK